MLGYATSQPLLYEPGTNWNYAHTNYVLLGMALEKATGQDMPKLLADKVLRPLGLTNTANSFTPEIPAPVLHAFTSERREALKIPSGTPFYEESTYWNPSWTITHGAIQTTNIYDMEASAVGLGSGKLLSKESYEKMVSTDLRGKTHVLPGCTTCAEMNDVYTYGMGIVISGDWLLQNPLFAGEAGCDGLPAAQEDRDRRRRHLPARGLRRRRAITTTRRDTLFRRIAKELAPDDAPPVRRRNNVGPWRRKVLFIYNEHLATEGLLGDAFTECGYRHRRHSRWCPPSGSNDPAGDVTFPDPTDYDVIVPLGARWPVYDDALRQTWVGAEMQMVRDAADAGVPTLGVCFGGQLLAQAFGGSVARSATPEIGWYDVDERRREPGSRRAVVPVALRPAGRCRREPPKSPAPRTASQAFVLGRALALQFHPEVDHDLLEVWLGRRPRRRGRRRRPAVTTNYVRRTTELADERGRPHPRPGARLPVAGGPSAVPELMGQRVRRRLTCRNRWPSSVSLVGTTR